MKNLILKSLAASVVALLAGHAMAATPVPLTGAGTPDIAALGAENVGYATTYASGSSAATPFIINAMKTDCTGTIYQYVSSGSQAYLCSKADTFLGVATPFLIMHKRDGGGSINGVKASQGTQQTFLDVPGLATATACAAPVNGVSNCTAPAAFATVLGARSELNLADVDPTQFNFALNGGPLTGVLPTYDAFATQIFGVAVNTRLRDALQTAQSTDPDGVGPLNAPLAAGCVGVDSEACMPNLTTEHISTIFAGPAATAVVGGLNSIQSGHFTDWAKLRTGTTTSLQNLFSANVLANQPGNRDIHICTRTAGSGTLATFHIKYHNAPCNGGIDESIVTPTGQTISQESGANGGVKIVHAMSGSADTENCLVGLNNGAAQGTFSPYPITVPAVDAKPFRWAIGIMGVERNASGTLPYRFIKIDGFAPTARNVVEGKYKFWAEAGVMPPAGQTATTDPLALEILKNMTDPSLIANLNVLHLWSTNGEKTGFLGIAGSPTSNPAFAPTFNTLTNGLMGAAFDNARPVNPYSHTTATKGNLNHCRVPTAPSGAPIVLPMY